MALPTEHSQSELLRDLAWILTRYSALLDIACAIIHERNNVQFRPNSLRLLNGTATVLATSSQGEYETSALTMVVAERFYIAVPIIVEAVPFYPLINTRI